MWKRNLFKNRIRASAEEQSGEASIPIKQNPKPSRYHPFEEIAEPELIEGGDARLTAAETTRTLIEVFIIMYKYLLSRYGMFVVGLRMNFY